MYNIEVIKHIVCYEQKDFISQLVETTKVLENDNLEVDIQYSTEHSTYTALIIGRRADNNKVDKILETKKKGKTTQIWG